MIRSRYGVRERGGRIRGASAHGSGSRAMLLLAALPALAGPAAAQDQNILMPVDSIESRLSAEPFEIADTRGTRFEGDRTNWAALAFEDGQIMAVKVARAPEGGEAFNNSPRYEVAAYEVQKLFLDPDMYVVPPTVMRAFPLDWYRRVDPDAPATIHDTRSVVTVLQYWLSFVTDDDVWDKDRFAADTAYARRFANFNVLTYLIHHNDSNKGNFLISRDSANPRVFAVDNGLSFDSRTSDRGAYWRSLRVDRLPATTVERLRGVTRDDLERRLATLDQFRIREDRQLEWMIAGPSFAPRRGVRAASGIVQFGLTDEEIDDVWQRIQRLLRDVDSGDIDVF